jgi:hypothetical protein
MNTEKRNRIETFEYLNERFEYLPSTGQLFWKVLFPGKEAGTVVRCASPFVKLALERLDFKAHRLAWILHHGKKPDDGMVIDHRDGDATNNAISNLRLCTPRENSRNSLTSKNNTTGFKGVSRQGKRYRSYICVDRKQIHLGRFDTAEEAFAAYMDAAKRHFGEFKSYG